MSLTVKKGYSNNSDTQSAFEEVKASIDQADISIVILFVSSHYDLQLLGELIDSTYDIPVVACTTSGEISPTGYPDGSMVATSIASEQLDTQTYLIEELADFTIEQAELIGEEIRTKLSKKQKINAKNEVFGLLLIDGLSVAEENVAANLSGTLPNISFIGGSAGDDLNFKKTQVYYNGQFRSNIAVFTSFISTLPFYAFKIQHFVPVVDAKMVITEAEPEKRIVSEINGLPAAQEYARFVGVNVEQLEPMTFSKYPVMLKIGGDYYVRSIQKVNEDESLTFYCAIDEGLVLTLAKGVDIIDNLSGAFETIKENIAEPKIIIGCECILRRLEILEKNLQQQAASVMDAHNVIGFHTYGEQYNGLHVNQTFTAIAIGEE